MAKRRRVSFWDNANILKYIVVMDAQLHEYTRSQQTIHFKQVNCMVFELYLNKTVKKKKKN